MSKKCIAWAIMFATLMGAGGLAGCGGGTNEGRTPGAIETPAPSVNITRATEGSFSESARILAARDAAMGGEVWLSAENARLADVDLAAIRRAYPQVANIEARPEYDLHTVLVAVSPTASFLRNWLAGNAATGEAALDAVLTEFVPEKIEAVGTPAEGGTYYFMFRFGQSLNMVKLAERLRGISSTIVAADPNYIAGGGDNIIRGGAAGNSEYVFSRGSGDCPAGCINRHSFVFDIAEGGAVTLVREEDNTPDVPAPQ